MSSRLAEDLIISAKLHRPPLSKDHIHRDRLIDRLESGLNQTLSLISAPAGYGKSTLASCWIEKSSLKNAWISLDSGDNDLRLFLLYFITAIRTNDEQACKNTLSLLQGAHLPSESFLSRQLINEIDQIESNFIIVLDDYHHIHDKRIHSFIADLMQYPPSCIHLVLVGRRDPPLPLVSWRAKGQMMEVRTQDLRFSLEETRHFLRAITRKGIDSDIMSILIEKTEGWVTGLRLAALSMLQHGNLEDMLQSLPSANRYVMEYVLEELIADHKPIIQECILKISILNHFCAPLCDKVCFPEDQPESCNLDSQEFLKILNDSSLFITPLDNDNEWFRYHHLIQVILKRLLRQRLGNREIAELYKRASQWFAARGNVEQALSYSFDINDYDAAAKLVSEHRYQLMNQEQWYRLDLWMKKFPVHYIERDLSLLMTQAWIYHRQARYSKLFELLENIDEKNIINVGGRKTDAAALLGEIETLKCFYNYTIGQPRQAERLARAALKKLPVQHSSIRGMALIILSLALQQQGDFEQSQAVVNEAWQDEPVDPVYKTMLLVALCYGSWITADLDKLKPAADLLIKTGNEHHLPETIDVGRFFTGIRNYEQNELDQAEQYLLPIYKNPVACELVVPSLVTYCQSSFALSLTYQAKNRPDKAREISETVLNYMLDTGNMDLLEICRAFQAELALRQGHLEQAESWFESYTPRPLVPIYRFYAPHITFARILASRRGAEDLDEADLYLSQMYNYFSSLHSNRVLIFIQILRSTVRIKKNDINGSIKFIDEAVRFAKRGGIIRPFLDLGSELEPILRGYLKNCSDGAYAAIILHAINSRAPIKDNGRIGAKSFQQSIQSGREAIQPLSNREVEVLKMLELGGRNKDIAQSLCISEETVKRHLSTIYRKLDVSNRHQALHQAKAIGIL